jgi:carbamoyl-phosphate synthase small subunit
MKPALLVLESGRVFAGRRFGSDGERFAEVVFNTSLTGYQEILSDPSYAGQIVVMTAVEIGNTGVTAEDLESSRPACAGMVVRELSPVSSNWRSQGDLAGFMREHGLVGLTDVDTRALTRALRDDGAMRGVIADPTDDIAALLARVKSSPVMTGRDLVPEVSCRAQYTWDQPSWQPADHHRDLPAAELHVVAYDFGIKRNILRDLRDVGCRVTVVPATTPAAEALALSPDGLFLSNGPGDPAAVSYGIETTRALVDSGKPVFGICLGHQILALALGARTVKLPFGHHGGNHPVMELATRKVEITSQNHGFAVVEDGLPSAVECTHRSLYDQTVEGIRLRDRPVWGVQYHPEASPGPHDAAHLFGRFVASMRGEA